MTCLTYVQLFIKWFQWLIQLWSENLIFFIFKKSDTALIQASITNCTNVIGTLLYLLNKFINLITTLFLCLTFLIPDFFVFLMKFYIFLLLLFMLFFNFRIWLVLHFSDNLFSFQQFLGIYTFYISVPFQDFPDTFLPDK